MRGLNSLIATFLLLVLIVSAEEGSGSDNDSSDKADVDQTDQNSDNLGPSEDEACDDCEEVISSLGEDTPTSNVTELKVLESATFSMTSVGSTSIYVRLDRVEGQDNLQMVCQITETGSGELFQSEDCKPSIYLVADHENCAGLSGNVTAQKLAHVEEAGQGEAEVEVTWNNIKGSCMVLLRPRSCDEEESESVVEVGGDEDEGSGDPTTTTTTIITTTTSENAASDRENALERDGKDDDRTSSREGIDWDVLTLEQERQPRRVRGGLGILRKPEADLAKTFQSISLDRFTLLSTGTTSAFASVATLSKVTSPIYNGLVATTYNPWATFPIVQLPGLTPEHVALVAATGLLMLFAFSYLTSESSRPIRQRVTAAVESGVLTSRMEALTDGLVDLLHRTAVETPYEFLVAVANRIDRGLLRSPSFDQSAPVRRQDEKANEDWASYDYSVSAFS